MHGGKRSISVEDSGEVCSYPRSSDAFIATNFPPYLVHFPLSQNAVNILPVPYLVGLFSEGLLIWSSCKGGCGRLPLTLEQPTA